MRARSTAMLLIAAAIPVVAAFVTRPDSTPPELPASPVVWAPALRTVVDEPAGTSAVAARGSDLLIAATATGIYRSTDGGMNWKQAYTSQLPVHAVAFASDDVVIAAADRGVLGSDDGGARWTELRLRVRFNAYDVVFTSSRAGYVVGGIGQLLRTRDAGATWDYEMLPTRAALNGIAVIDTNTLIIVGSDGTILRSADAGDTWQRIESGTVQHLHDVAFADALHGVAVGMWGTVLITQDGGRTWIRENPGTQDHLTDVAFDSDGVATAMPGAGSRSVLRRLPHAR